MITVLSVVADDSNSMTEGSFDCIVLHKRGLYVGGQVNKTNNCKMYCQSYQIFLTLFI